MCIACVYNCHCPTIAGLPLLVCHCLCTIAGLSLLVYHCWSTIAGLPLLVYHCWCTIAGVPLLVYHCWCTIAGLPLLVYYCWCTIAGVLLLVYHCWFTIAGLPLLVCYFWSTNFKIVLALQQLSCWVTHVFTESNLVSVVIMPHYWCSYTITVIKCYSGVAMLTKPTYKSTCVILAPNTCMTFSKPELQSES